jgi:hypothetical protein
MRDLFFLFFRPSVGDEFPPTRSLTTYLSDFLATPVSMIVFCFAVLGFFALLSRLLNFDSRPNQSDRGMMDLMLANEMMRRNDLNYRTTPQASSYTFFYLCLLIFSIYLYNRSDDNNQSTLHQNKVENARILPVSRPTTNI